MRMVDGGWQERPHREEQLLFHDIEAGNLPFSQRIKQYSQILNRIHSDTRVSAISIILIATIVK